MPDDITMCDNEECPLRRHCYRFSAKPDSYYSYAHFEFEKDCDYFISYFDGGIMPPPLKGGKK